ncbi:MAG: 6,7-dimethyl-8-ribityllumazine synthase [Actinomycetota bacterium]
MAGQKKRPESPLDASTLRVAIVVAEFNADITERLLEGARKCLAEHDVSEDAIGVAWVPGAFELPLGVRMVLDGGDYDGAVALGCVVRGGTPHFEYVCQAATYGLQRVALDTGVPIGFGVLTTDDFAQAEARAGGAEGNKGFDAAQSVIQMALLRRDVAP